MIRKRFNLWLKENIVLKVFGKEYNRKHLIFIFWFIAIVLGAISTWNNRHVMNPDGISYLDMGDAYLRGDWKMAINAYWSPFYSWLLGIAMKLLKPTLYWEFSVAHLVNFMIYLCALACFQFFLFELICYCQKRATIDSKKERITLPEWALLALGYTLFIWSSLNWITISNLTPDMCVAAFVYLASGLLLRIKRGFWSWSTFIMLGVVLGLGYLAKAAMFLVAFIFLGSSIFLVGSLRKAMPRVLIASVFFSLVIGPFIITLSSIKGRLTFGDSGRLNYILFVNEINNYFYWQGESAKSGIPKHPVRKISESPVIYEFGSPVRGTYPVWYDVSYWKESIKPYFDLKKQLRVLYSNLMFYFDLFFNMSSGGLIVGLLILCFMMDGKRFLCIKNISEYWFLFVPAIAALSFYSFVFVQLRYISAFVILLWMGFFSSINLSDTQESRRLVTSVVSAIVLQIMIILTCSLVIPTAYSAIRYLVKGENASVHQQYQIAKALKQIGIKPADKVALFGGGFEAYWARLARIQIVAEMPHQCDIDKFYFGDNMVKSQVIKTFAETGAKAIVARWSGCGPVTDWERIENTDYYVYIF